MYIEDAKSLDKDTLLSTELLNELFLVEHLEERERYRQEILDRAETLKIKTRFNKLYNAKAIDLRKSEYIVEPGMTEYDETPRVKNLVCKSYKVEESGIIRYDEKGLAERITFQPITIIEKLENEETGEEKVVIACYLDGKWKERTVSKEVIATSRRIVELSKFGFHINSENAKGVVKFLEVIESLNPEAIKNIRSTSKLGWHGNRFLPYNNDNQYRFDNEDNFRDLYESLKCKGNYEIWLYHVRQLRKRNRNEINMMLAGSFASVITKIVGSLPFFVDLWGETEGGKTVSLMLAASVWGNPTNKSFLGDLDSTLTAIETKADVLNNLPLILDDTSKTSSNMAKNFETFIYDITSGKGKSRSNKDLGNQRECRWNLVALCNGEKPLSGYVQQGGAVNRIIEVEAGNKIFANPRETADCLKENYGFAGKIFIDAVSRIGSDGIKTIYKDFYKALSGIADGKMEKQIMAMSVLLTADKIATDEVFKDGRYISIETANNVLMGTKDVSENERCYQYLLDTAEANSECFGSECDVRSRLGIESTREYSNCYIFFAKPFQQLLKQENYSYKAFMNWADKKGLLKSRDKDAYTKTLRYKVKNDTKQARMICLINERSNGFMDISEDEEGII